MKKQGVSNDPRRPGDGASGAIIRFAAQAPEVAGNPIVQALMTSFEGPLLIFDKQCRLIAFNASSQGRFSVEEPTEILGLRPGEAIRCRNLADSGGECGNTRHCEFCGLLRAIERCRDEGGPAVEEWLLSTGAGSPNEEMTFRVRASLLDLDLDTFTVVCLRDISDRKRRQSLEQIFFHDVLNTLTGLVGWSEFLSEKEEKNSPTRPAVEKIRLIVRRLEYEIEAQRDLCEAEAGILEPNWRESSVSGILESVSGVLRGQACCKEKTLAVPETMPRERFVTDENLLARVLTNMAKNAFEATGRGGVVRLWSDFSEERRSFHVWNEGEIAPEIAERVFQRYFTTKKGEGRGLGGYSMKLLGERYLDGEVSFTTSAEEGTIFSIRLPLK